MLQGLGPSAQQSTLSDHLNSREQTPHSAPEMRPVNIRTHWSLLEVLMEPLFYNVNIPGRWGSRNDNPPLFISKARQRNGNARIIRTSKERKNPAY